MRAARTRRLVAGCLVGLLLSTASASGASAPDRSSGHRVQPLAALNHTADVFAHPWRNSTPLYTIHGAGPITGERTVLPVLGRATSANSVAWLDVRLPGRPNGHTGWIHASAATQTTTPWTVTVNLAKRQVRVLKYGRPVRTFRAVVGKRSTPTPTGTFFVEESVSLSASMPGAPYALALSARSEVFHRFDGGPGQIALHGLGNLLGVPGTAASHGCVRLSTPDITWLVHHIQPGVTVTISS